MSVEVDVGDVIKLILQFLKEQHLTTTLQTLEEEAGIVSNTVDRSDAFAADILGGKWDSVMKQVSHLKLPTEILFMLYEQIVIELMEIKEFDAAKVILQTCEAMKLMKEVEPERFGGLLRLLQRSLTSFNPTEAYDSRGFGGKLARRKYIAESVSKFITTIPPSRLLVLIGQALKWQQFQGLLPQGSEIDLFRGVPVSKEDEHKIDLFPTKQTGFIKFGEKSYPECCSFSPDGQYLVTGSVDGFIEVWNYLTCTRKDFDYQKADEFMIHDSGVLCLAFSSDSEFLASGDASGGLKIWKITTGKCLKFFPSAHSKGITSVMFSPQSTHVLSSSFDETARIHGLKSGRILKEFAGHTSFVNKAVYSTDGTKVISASADGTLKFWDTKTAECLQTLTPPSFVITRSSSCYLYSSAGQLKKTLTTGVKEGGCFVSATLSPQGTILYCLAEDNKLYGFDTKTESLEHVLSTESTEVVCLAHHPHQCLVVTCGEDGILKLWKN